MAACPQLAGARGAQAGPRLLPGSCRAARASSRTARPAARRPLAAQAQADNARQGVLDKAALGALPLLLRAGEAGAVEGVPDQPTPGASAGEVLLLAAPILLYGVFSVYRAKLNPRAKLSDFLFIAAAAVIVLNILSILIFKVRLY